MANKSLILSLNKLGQGAAVRPAGRDDDFVGKMFSSIMSDDPVFLPLGGEVLPDCVLRLEIVQEAQGVGVCDGGVCTAKDVLKLDGALHAENITCQVTVYRPTVLAFLAFRVFLAFLAFTRPGLRVRLGWALRALGGIAHGGFSPRLKMAPLNQARSNS